ncbi:MAG: hypothetical protein M3Y65_24820 [Pseudomonadota bacterium]|nr:hypothetical protein [Pseudomonadota bacterium]
MENVIHPKLAIFENRLDRMERAIDAMVDNLASLVRVQVQNETILTEQRELTLELKEIRKQNADELKAVRAEVQAIRDEMPAMKMLKAAAGLVVIGAFAAIGSALLKLIHLGA